MADREWVYKSHTKEFSITVPNKESMDKIDEIADQANDSFLSALLLDSKGVLIRFNNNDYLGKDIYGNPRLPENFNITLPPKKAHELAQWLLKMTKDLE